MTLKKPERIWIMKNGEDIKINNMSDQHIINTIRMLEKKAKIGREIVVSYGYFGDDDYITGELDWVEGEEYLKGVDEYFWLMEEAKKRKLL